MVRRDDAPPDCKVAFYTVSICRADDLRYLAEKYGRLRDVYMPRDYYTGEPRGIGFLEFVDPRDAEDARDGLDRSLVQGREVTVVFAQQGRKTPNEFRSLRRNEYSGRRRSYSRSPRRRSYSPRRSHRSPRRYRSSSRERNISPRRRHSPSLSRSYSRSKSRSRSGSRSRSLSHASSDYSRSRSPSKRRSSSSPDRSAGHSV